MKCILCQNVTKVFISIKDREYLKCSFCNSVMLNPKNYLNSVEEKARYKEHNNDVFDKRYQAFVSPIVDSVLKDYSINDKGLDFGSGTGPVITKLLRDQDYNINIYDPFFANKKQKLEEKYDYIVCCEVVEHFHNPRQEFTKLKTMLNPDGTLYIKTKIYNDQIDFNSWYYKDDPTHVFFYHEKALEYIEREYSFSGMTIIKDMITYKNK